MFAALVVSIGLGTPPKKKKRGPFLTNQPKSASLPSFVFPSSSFRSLGLPADVGFHDIFGFDPDLLAMVRARFINPSPPPPPRRPIPTTSKKYVSQSLFFSPVALLSVDKNETSHACCASLSFRSCVAGASAGARGAAAVPHHRQVREGQG